MNSALDTYLGWEQPEHLAGCKRPSWEIGTRRKDRVLRRYWDGEPPLQHGCAEHKGECEHGNTFVEVMVRMVCRSCGAVHIVTGEDTESTGSTITSTRNIGYGLPARQAAGLLLWPGQPRALIGRLAADEPFDYVLTRTGVKTVTQDVVVGQLTLGRGKLNGLVWTALAVPDPDGRYGWGTPIHWAQRNDGHGDGGRPLRTVGAAARWVGARLAEAEAGGER